MNMFYVVENIHEILILAAGTAAALMILTCTIFCFPKDDQ
uniref:Uncharacterized protein n=1 Tax=Rheinheimera sp. BAL341 TaxID=1708203 RepID=A0A486XSU0_9GAMM